MFSLRLHENILPSPRDTGTFRFNVKSFCKAIHVQLIVRILRLTFYLSLHLHSHSI